VKSNSSRLSLATGFGLLLTACATNGPVTEVVDAGCYWTAPILVSQQDQLTEGTAEQILAHNEVWKQRCRDAADR